MGLLQNSTTYLVGPIEFSDGSGWRDIAHIELAKMGIMAFDPMRKKSWYPKTALGSPKEYITAIKGEKSVFTRQEAFFAAKFLIDVDLRYVHSCDFILAYLPIGVCTYGSVDELMIAAATKKPILVFGPGRVASSWIVPKIADANNWEDSFFETLDDALNYLRKVDKNEVPIDPLLWTKIAYFNPEAKVKVY